MNSQLEIHPINTSHLPVSGRRIIHSITTMTTSFSSPYLFSLLPQLRRLLPSLPCSFLSSFLSSSPSILLPLLLPCLLPHLPSPLPFHSPILKLNLLSSSPYISSSLLHSYSLFHFPCALQVFDDIPHSKKQLSTSTFTTLIQSHNHHNHPHLALSLFNSMLYSGIPPNRVTMVCALSACAARAALHTGTWIHDYVTRKRWKLDVVLGTALVNMYGKCGRVDEGLKVFLAMEERNVYTWNALIGGFARAGSGEEAVRWFSRMEVGLETPDEVTLIEVLSACSRSGLGFVQVGRKVFEEMSRGKYGFLPGVKHYGCMVDMLGRAGMVEEAFEMVEKMEQPGVVVWGSLLAGCRAHGRLELAVAAAMKMLEMEPDNVGHYVLLSNLYGEMGRWREAEEVWMVVKDRGLRKDAGWSFEATASEATS